MPARAIDYLFVTNIPSPYQVDFFNALQKHRPGTFHVIFCAASESDRQFVTPTSAQFSMEILESSNHRLMKDWHHNPALRERLAQLSPQIVVIGGSYFMPDARLTRAHCLRNNIPWIFWGENPLKKGTGGVKTKLKQLYVARFLASAAGAIGVGSLATQSYATLIPHRPTTNIPYSPDLAKLLAPNDSLRAQAQVLRRQWIGLTDGIVVLFSGALTERKAPELLLRAFESAATAILEAHLVFVGDGPMHASLTDAARDSHFAARVHFPGFLHGESLAAAYLAADLFVLPSRWHEGWGVVVQEAMAAGLPVIASNLVGAGHDLLASQGTGLRFESDSLIELSTHLGRLLSDPAERRRMSARARDVVCGTSAPAAAAKFVAFAGSVLN